MNPSSVANNVDMRKVDVLDSGAGFEFRHLLRAPFLDYGCCCEAFQTPKSGSELPKCGFSTKTG